MGVPPARFDVATSRTRWIAIVLGLGVAVALLVVVRSEGPIRIPELATNRLHVPELLEPTLDGSTARYDLALDESVHDYGDGVAVDTLAYNDRSMYGPTLLWRTGSYVSIDVTNDTDAVTTTHWHGADVPASDDGGPHSGIGVGETWTADFPVIQQAATLWYHPHRDGTTGSSVFRGAVGMVIVEDDSAASQSLPGRYGVDDIPVILQNPDRGDDGQLLWEDEQEGPETTVNGTFDPFVDVPEGPVRLRILNASQKAIYELSTDRGDITIVASDGGLLERPVDVRSVTVAPGDRIEVVLDTRDGVINLVDDDWGAVLELRPDPDLEPAPDLPSELATIDRIDPSTITVDRFFHMDRVDGRWMINDAQMDMSRIDQIVEFGDVERWILTSDEGAHAFHVHQTQFQILEINGEPPPEEERGWEDTVFVSENRSVTVVARFDTYTNPVVPYMFHCHILPHEERGMMGQFQIVGDGPDDA
ncbi:MAG: multicopper oxidase domain-containing protein [Actinomycetota bacterium]